MAEAHREDNVEIRRDPHRVHDVTARPVEEGPRWGASLRRISWGAVFAGVVVALVSQLLLTLLGLGLGLGAVDLVGQQAQGDGGGPGIGLAVGIWWVVTALVSLFLGGYVAGRLAGAPQTQDGLLHGVVTWGVATLVSVYLITNVVGTLVSGAVSVVTDSLALAGQGVAAVAGEAAGAATDEASQQVTLREIKAEAQQILRETGREDLQPAALEDRAETVLDTMAAAAGEALRSPQQAEAEIEAALNRLATAAERTVDDVDREAVANVLVARTDMSRDEAMRTVRGWEARLESAAGAVGDAASDVAQGSVGFADDALDTASDAALWAFLAMLLGLGAAAVGGAIGTPPLPTVAARARAA